MSLLVNNFNLNNQVVLPKKINFNGHKTKKDAFERQNLSYFPVSNPEDAIKWSYETRRKNIESLIGEKRIRQAFDIYKPYLAPDNIDFNKIKIIGIHPRIAKTFGGIISYAMTSPNEGVHLLPLLEPGCANSLYAASSWNVNNEFMDAELTSKGYDTPEKQLKLTVNVLHSLGKKVGIDVVPHTDRFSQQVFTNPDCFYWIHVENEGGKDVGKYLQKTDGVKQTVKEFLETNGDINGKKINGKTLEKLYELSDEERERIIFGKADKEKRDTRRVELMNAVRAKGYETVPVSIESANRLPVFDKYNSIIVDGKKITWAEFKFPDDFEYGYELYKVHEDRVNPPKGLFGNLTPYKFYDIDDKGFFKSDSMNKKTVDYFANKVSDFVNEYHFDFSRNDMMHLQYSQANKKSQTQQTDEAWHHIKNKIKEKNPDFKFFGEIFGENIYTEGLKDAENKRTDVILGASHYKKGQNFTDLVKKYSKSDSKVKQAVTVMTTDLDEPVYNDLLKPNLIKLREFYKWFMPLPGYSAIGYETKEDKPKEKREAYTLNFTNVDNVNNYAPFEWRKNNKLYFQMSKMQMVYDKIKSTIKKQNLLWLGNSSNTWMYYDKNTNLPSYVFITNPDTERVKPKISIENPFNALEKIDKSVNKQEKAVLEPVLSTDKTQLKRKTIYKNKPVIITNLAPGEGRIYKVINEPVNFTIEKSLAT